MTSKPTISADTPPTTVWSNDVAGGGVVLDELPNVAGMKKGEVANTPASSSSKKKKKKKKQQQLQKEKVEEDLPVAGEDDEEDAETPGVTEVTESKAMSAMAAPVETTAQTPVDVEKQDEVEVPAELDTALPAVADPIEPVSNTVENDTPTRSRPETVEHMETAPETTSDSLFDPIQDDQNEDWFARAAAPADKEDSLFGPEAPETEEFAGILETSFQESGDVETESAVTPVAQPIEAERVQEADYSPASILVASTTTATSEMEPTSVESRVEAHREQHLFAEEAEQGDELFGSAGPDSAQLFGSSEMAAHGEPVALEPVLSSGSPAAEAQIDAEELFPDQSQTEAFDLATPAELTFAPAAAVNATEPITKANDQDDLFSGTEDAQEEYFSQVVQAGRETPDVEADIHHADEADIPTEIQVESSAEAVETTINGDQPSPDPFGADAVEDDFFSRPTETPPSAPEEDTQLDLPIAGRARASTTASDLFETNEADDLFAGLGAPNVPDDAFATSEGVIADSEAFGKLDVASEMFAEDPSLANDNWMGQDATAQTINAEASHPDKPAELDGADLDLMGVPEGWVDGNGKWCWYTEDERMDVARQMVADGTAEAPEKPFPARTVKQPEPIETSPAPSSPAANPYAPSSSQSYTPYQPSPSVAAAAIPYVPTPARNAYTPVPATPYVPSAYSTSAYGAPGYAPSSSGSQPYGVSPAIPQAKAILAPALERTKTSTAYDPPVITSRNLSRPPSAAPVLSQYTPMPMPITPAPSSLPVSPPPLAPGPPRSTLLPRNAASIKSTLGGRSTPTAYDPPVPAMNRQASYARLRPAAEVAPPLPLLPPVAAPVAPALPPPPPPPPRGPSRNANLIQPPPAAGIYRPPSRARNEAPASPVPVPPVPPMPQGVVGGNRSQPTSATSGSASGQISIPAPDVLPKEEQPRQAPPSASPYLPQGALPPLPSASPPQGAPANASVLSPNAMSQAGRDRLTPQRGEYDAGQMNPTWPPQNVSPAKSRPVLRQDTFQPPQEEGGLVDPEDAMLGDQLEDSASGLEPTFEQEQPVIDPYKPMPISAPAAPTYTPVAAPSNYQPSSVAAYQPSAPDQMTPLAYLTPAPNAFVFPTENMASPPNTYESPGYSNYAPAPENAPKSLSEDVLERASEKAKRVPCVSFGPQGQLVVVFQTATADTAFSETGQKLLPAYGDTSRSQKVQLYPLSDVLSGGGDTAASSDWPGPLFVDGTASKVSASAKKKRDAVNEYIDTRVQEIQSGLVYLNASRRGDAGRQSAEAKMIMLQVIKLMIATDGKSLTSDPTSKADLVELLAKHQDVSEMDSARQRQKTAELSASSSDLQFLSRMLIKGQQQEAQQFAMQQQLWSHALLISSVMGPQAWQACVDAFVAQTTSGGAELAQPLVTAYKLFGGTQQLAPADSQSGAWRDTVATVVANIKTADSDTLIRLADQLKQNNLVEASQLCYLLSPKLNEWASGSSPARVSLFGCRDISQTARDLELSELTEYAISFKPTPKGTEAFHGVPQLLPYKLQRAFEAFTVGRSLEARAYIDAVLAQIRAQKTSNPTFAALGKLAEALSGRIAGVPVTAAATKKGGKPNLENLGSWFEGRLTKFIAGDEEAEAKPVEPAATKDSAPAAAVGPFSHYSAISSPNATPSLTRSSTYDPTAHQSIVPGPHTYRSGSAASYRPRQPSQLSMQRPTSAMSYRAQDQVPELTRIASHITEQDGFGSRQEFEQEPASEAAERSTASEQDSAIQQGEEPTAAYQMPTWGQSYDEPAAKDGDSTDAEVTDEGSSAAFINPMQAYMTPMSAGTTTPSYGPQATPPPAFDDDEDDDDLGLGNSSGKKPSVQAEKEAPSTENKGKSAYEPAPKKAAAVTPATAQKGAVQDSGKGSQSGSWLGKWWGGKKEEAVGPGPVKAKLGDESAFYYDKDLKRWINKTAGATEAPKAPPPPPPGARATPVPTSSGPPSKPATPMTAAPPGIAPPPPTSRAPSVPAVAGPPSMSPAPRSTPSGPPGPPKPSGMNAADPPLSDPLAAPPSRKGAAKGKKDLRAKYVNIM